MRKAAALLVIAFGLTACSSKAPEAAPSSSSPPSATTTSKPTPTTTAPPPLAAANGSDVKACQKADCQILLTGAADVPLAAKFGVHQFSLKYVAPNRVEFTMIRTKMGYSRGYIAGEGHLSFANGLSLDVERVDATGAVLRFLPKTDNPKADTGNSSEGLAIYGGSG